MNDTLLTAQQVAEQLNCHVITIRHMITRGDLKATRIGKKREYRVYQSSVDSYLKNNTVVAEAQPESSEDTPCKGTLNDSNKGFSLLRT